jgi:hypothetical protein
MNKLVRLYGLSLYTALGCGVSPPSKDGSPPKQIEFTCPNGESSVSAKSGVLCGCCGAYKACSKVSKPKKTIIQWLFGPDLDLALLLVVVIIIVFLWLTRVYQPDPAEVQAAVSNFSANVI